MNDFIALLNFSEANYIEGMPSIAPSPKDEKRIVADRFQGKCIYVICFLPNFLLPNSFVFFFVKSLT